jgi:hypothetical protein
MAGRAAAFLALRPRTRRLAWLTAFRVALVPQRPGYYTPGPKFPSLDPFGLPAELPLKALPRDLP